MSSSRNDWFYRRSAFPLRDAIPLELEKVWTARVAAKAKLTVNWTSLGPENFAGRVTSLVRHKDTLYAGSAAGGVWKSQDLGRSWMSIWPTPLSQNIGALALHPDAPEYLICATGEGNLTSNTYPGSGIFCTENGGATWTPWISNIKAQTIVSEEDAGIPRRIASLALERRVDGQFVVAFGAVSKDEAIPAGLFLEREHADYTASSGLGGANRFITEWGPRSYNCHSVIFHPGRPEELYCAIEPRGTRNGIYRTSDSGATWKKLHRGLPPGERCGRITLAISPADPQVLYALIGDIAGSFLGLFRSSDGGESWRRTSKANIRGEDDLYSNSTLAVHPEDPDVVAFGARNLYLSTNGGENWKSLKTPSLVSGHHALLLFGPPGKPWIVSGHDAGVALSENGGATWSSRSSGMVSTMFYNVDVSPTTSRIFGGGAQDIGALLRTQSSNDYVRPFKGDGGLIAFDPSNSAVIYGTNADGRVFRHAEGASYRTGWKSSSPPLTTAEKKLRSLYLLAIRPSNPDRNRGQQRWLATSRLWFSPAVGKAFRPASAYLDKSAISALAFSPVNPDLIVAGTSDGGVYRYVEDPETLSWSWTPNLAGPDVPARLITQIRCHPAEPETLILSVGSTNIAAADLKGVKSPFSHVFRSRDAGRTWADIDQGALPNVVYNALAYETDPPYRIFAGGDVGVFVFDEQNWVDITGNLPNVIISDLHFHRRHRVLTAATFGRGIWRVEIPKV